MKVMNLFVLHNLKLEFQKEEGNSIKGEPHWIITWWVNGVISRGTLRLWAVRYRPAGWVRIKLLKMLVSVDKDLPSTKSQGMLRKTFLTVTVQKYPFSRKIPER